MYFLLWLSLAIYFGLLSAWNVCLVARLPGPISRGAATCIGGLIFLFLLGYFGLVFDVWEAGHNPPILSTKFIYKFGYLHYFIGDLEGYLVPYVVLALTILVSYVVIARWGLTKVDDKPRAASWPLGQVLVAVLFALGCVATVFRTLDHQIASNLKQQSFEASERLKQLAGPTLPDSENALCHYGKILEDHTNHSLPYGYIRWYGKEGKLPVSIPEFQQFVDDLHPTIVQVRSVADYPSFQIPGKSIFTRSSKYIPFNVPDWLHLDAHVRASQGQSQEALKDIVALKRMAAQWSQTSHDFIHSQALKMDKLANRTIEQLLPLHIFTSEDLAQLSQKPWPDRGAGLPRCLDHKAQEFRITLEKNYKATGDLAATEVNLRILFARQDQLTLQKAEAQYRSILKQPSWIRLKVMYLRFSNHAEFVGLCSSLELMNWDSLIYSTIDTETQDRLTLVGIAVYRYALQMGHFPQSLENLVAFDPGLNITDPCSGKPFAMVLQQDKLILYSVGPNQQVDRNKPQPLDGSPHQRDPQFVVPLPPSPSLSN